MGDLATHVIPKATVTRFPVYLRALLEEAMAERALVSSERLALMSGVSGATVRKDLACLGSHGIRGVGYDVRYLVDQISLALGLGHRSSVVIVGVGNIGRALARYTGFAERGFPIVALLDADPDTVGTEIGGVVVQHVGQLPAVLAARRPTIAVVAVPADVAQEVVDRLVAAGMACILSFEPVELAVPAHVVLRTVDLAVELQILACMTSRG